MGLAFEDFAAARGEALLRFALMLCGERHLAEDLVQSVLAKAYPRWSRIVAMHQPEAYLKTVLVNEHLRWWRQRSSRELPLAAPVGPHEPAGPRCQRWIGRRCREWDVARQGRVARQGVVRGEAGGATMIDDGMTTMVREAFRGQEHQVDGAAHELVPAVLGRVAARRRTRLAVTAGIAAAAVLAVAAGIPAIRDRAAWLPTAGPAQALPAGRTFIATSITKDGAPHPVVPGTRIELSFSATGVAGYAGCNHIGASARLYGGRLILTESLRSTLMGCIPAGILDQEKWLATFLSGKPAMSLRGNELFLSSGHTEVHLTDRRVADPDRPLVGPRWTAVPLVINGPGKGSLDNPHPELLFRSDGTVQGFDGCNSFRAQATVTGDQITISDFGVTNIACTKLAADVETGVMKILGQRLTYKIEGDRLTLTAPDGSRLDLTDLR